EIGFGVNVTSTGRALCVYGSGEGIGVAIMVTSFRNRYFDGANRPHGRLISKVSSRRRYFMELAMHRVFKILAPAGSLRRRVALSLAVVRLILAPVLFLSVYYLIKMDSILDRVLNVDAPMGTLAQRASIEILQARRAERSYLLLHNPAYLQNHGASLAHAKGILREMQDLESHEQAATREVLQDVALYEQQF